jgi:hypothetical protein
MIDLIQFLTSPVSVLSFMMQFPVRRTASQCITQPCEGTTIKSPGTRCSVGIVSILPVSPRITVTTSEECTVLRRLRWFCNMPSQLSEIFPCMYCISLGHVTYLKSADYCDALPTAVPNINLEGAIKKPKSSRSAT